MWKVTRARLAFPAVSATMEGGEDGDMKLDRRDFFYLLGLATSATALSGCWEGMKVLFKGTRERREAVQKKNPYTVDGKSLVAVVGGKDPGGMLKEAVSLLGGLDKIGVKGKTVLVKPNVVAAKKNPTTTNPEVVRAAVRLLYEEGASQVYVGDMSAFREMDTRKNMEKTGIGKAAREAGATVLHFEEHDWVKVPLPGGTYIQEVGVSEWVYQVDRVVNLPVVKTHRSAQYSITLKNFVGATHFKQRPYFVDRSHWEEVVAELNLAWSPDLNLVDGTAIMVEGGPWQGRAEEANLVIASADRVAADVVGLALIKAFGRWPSVASRSVWQQRQIIRAVELGLGARGRDELELRTASLDASPEFARLMGQVEANLG